MIPRFPYRWFAVAAVANAALLLTAHRLPQCIVAVSYVGLGVWVSYLAGVATERRRRWEDYFRHTEEIIQLHRAVRNVLGTAIEIGLEPRVKQ